MLLLLLRQLNTMECVGHSILNGGEEEYLQNDGEGTLCKATIWEIEKDEG